MIDEKLFDEEDDFKYDDEIPDSYKPSENPFYD